jgi:anaerobic magnesium-protoporphyrin IX monomethyl ester cyclase
VRAALPRAWIVYGGVLPTYHWSEIMEQEPAIDFIVRGEGEETVVRLVTALERGQGLEELPGIVFRAGSTNSLYQSIIIYGRYILAVLAGFGTDSGHG